MISYFLELSWHLDRIKIRRYGWRRRVVEEGAASIARPRGQQQLPNKEEAKRHRTNRSVIKNVSTTKQPRATWKSFILITNNKNFPRSKKKSRRALDSYIVFRMGENRTRAEPPSTEFKNSTRWLLLRTRGQSVALFPIERSKGGETIIFKPPPSPSPSIRVSLEEEAERHAYKDRESFFCC